MKIHDPLKRLIAELGKLPGIGEKTATRLAYFILKQDQPALAEAILQAKNKIVLCQQCFHFTDHPLCSLCSHPKRNPQLLCVIEQPHDLMSIEQSGSYSGLYHVLHGALSPLEGIGPEDLKIQPLFQRLSTHSIQEVILATNPSVEGEATASYLAWKIRSFRIRVTQLALGLSVGGVLEYTDKQTIARALANRMEIH